MRVNAAGELMTRGWKDHWSEERTYKDERGRKGRGAKCERSVGDKGKEKGRGEDKGKGRGKHTAEARGEIKQMYCAMAKQ